MEPQGNLALLMLCIEVTCTLLDSHEMLFVKFLLCTLLNIL